MWKQLIVGLFLVSACLMVSADDLDGTDDDFVNDSHHGPGLGVGNGDSFGGRGVFTGFTVVRPRTRNDIIEVDAQEYGSNEILPGAGITKECAVILDNISWQLQKNGQKSMCPKGPFGALIVNLTDTSGSVKDSQGNSCGRIMGTNSGLRDATDPVGHSEIDAIRRYAFQHPGNRFNTNMWGKLAIITSGASCPMDTTAELYAQMPVQMYSLSVADLIALNYSQIAIEPEELMRLRATLGGSAMNLVKYANREANVIRYAWRNILANPCPTGCLRPTPTSLCVDYVPYVFDTSMLIPDLNIYAPSTAFHLS